MIGIILNTDSNDINFIIIQSASNNPSIANRNLSTNFSNKCNSSVKKKKTEDYFKD